MVLEQYINGARSRDQVWSIEGIKWALDIQNRSIMAQAERNEAKKQAEIESRHNRVYKWTAESHGVQFANRVINGRSSAKLRARVNETELKSNKKVPVPVSVADVLADLI
jgi:hypothetical protein